MVPMHHLHDDDELYDLPEAARRLLADPARLQRWIRRGVVPAVRRRSGLALPRDWVDAATGATATDAEALRRYWTQRLAPPPADARRPARDRSRLPARELLPPLEAARRLFADPPRIARLEAEGVLPCLRVDGATVYDAALVALLADSEEPSPAADRRRDDVTAWGRHEYVTGLDEGAEPPDTAPRPAAREATAVAPGAWRIPDDLAAPEAPAPSPEEPSPLIEAEGFETEEEDE